MSSHREAPAISKDPVADNTDLYAFVDPVDPTKVTILSNFIPLEEPAGGPNFFQFGDDVLYEIMVDNNGDGIEDVTYQFRFKTSVENPNTFLYNTGPITSLTSPSWNVRQTYSIWKVLGPRRTGERTLIASDLASPPVNIGPRSTPDYAALAGAAIHSLSGGRKVFAGQRDEGFYVDLGSIFDLAGLRPFNGAHLIPLPPMPGKDDTKGYNVHTIALQVPKTDLLKAPAANGTIGIYASASRQRVRILHGNGSVENTGKWVQVSRLGNPLINEVVIPVGKKDRWNSTDPADDVQFLQHYTTPELAGIADALYAVLDGSFTTNRQDLVAVLLTGVPGLNFTGNTKADLLRLNTAIPPAASPDRLGVLAGDFAGFPNGRRLADDVTDIEIRAVLCGYGAILQGALGLCNFTPNNVIDDDVDANENAFLSNFPYVAAPNQGYAHTGHK